MTANTSDASPIRTEFAVRGTRLGPDAYVQPSVQWGESIVQDPGVAEVGDSLENQATHCRVRSPDEEAVFGIAVQQGLPACRGVRQRLGETGLTRWTPHAAW